MSSGSKPSTYSTTTQSSAPWSGQQEYLTTGYQRARDDILNRPTEFYPNSTVVPFSPVSEQALTMQEQRALAGSPVTQAAQSQVQSTVQGDFLNANPYLSQAITDATQPVVERFQEDIVPSIQSAYSSAGRYGSGLQQRGEERAAQAALDQASKIASDMSYRNFADERTRQLQAATIAPEMARQDYVDLQALKGVGVEREGMAGAQLQEDIQRFAQQQQAPKDALAQYMALVGGGGYTDQTTTEPLYRNKAGDILGGAATTAGIAGQLFGRQGIFPYGG